MPLDEHACYLALKAHDARFDGLFFTGVHSTGIYCRPICRVKTPKRENCRFFDHAAQAEHAGFRPCMRCRPELAPQAALPWSIQDASRTLALQAARWLDSPQAWGDENPSIARLARHLGVSDRHLRRIFEARFGVAPLQYLQTRRLLGAKQLLTDTDWPITRIAALSGYGSLRRFHAAFVAHYRLQPSQLRRLAEQGSPAAGRASLLRLAYRPPLDGEALLGFFARRQLNGLEMVDLAARTFRRTLRMVQGGSTWQGWVDLHFDADSPHLKLRVGEGLREALPWLIPRIRAWLDLDADPLAIDAVLGADFPGQSGLRVPGTLDGFELAVRAILGQQVSVVVAQRLTQRLVDALGEPVATPWPQLNRLFPTPECLAATPAHRLGELGVIQQRQTALRALAQAVAAGSLSLHATGDVQPTIERLLALPGIGDWTAQYIAMRALRWPDAFPAGDAALHKALGIPKGRQAAAQAQAAAHQWRPWRSYAVLRAWSRSAHPISPPQARTHEN